MGKNIVICLDGTNNQLRAAANTNVVRMFDLLDLHEADRQIAYYDAGVGTFSSPAAWTPFARTVSRYAGLAFGAGLRQNLGEAYTYLMAVHEPDDKIFVFGFSRGAYTARALTGMLEVFGLFRRGAENLVPYAVNEFTQQEERFTKEHWKKLGEYSRIFGRRVDGRKGHMQVHFLGLWDTVKAAGHLWRELRWPFTRQLPHATIVRHAVSIDEWRRPYREYSVHRPDPDHLIPTPQDLQEVWFAGVHSDVGGMFEHGARLSDVPLKWMAEQAVDAGLLVRARKWATVQEQVSASVATDPIHDMGAAWRLLGVRRRTVPEGANIHASAQVRADSNPAYRRRFPGDYTVVDREWATPRVLARSGSTADHGQAGVADPYAKRQSP
jgi:uncharacterized protein (DUF2235 family)